MAAIVRLHADGRLTPELNFRTLGISVRAATAGVFSRRACPAVCRKTRAASGAARMNRCRLRPEVPMHDTEIAATLDEIADLLEFQGANQFRVRAYRNAGRVIHDLAEPAERIVADANRRLTEISGIGDDLAEKIATLVDTGKMPMLEELRAKVPESVLALDAHSWPGTEEGGRALQRAGDQDAQPNCAPPARRTSVRELKGFGAKTEETILAGIGLAASPEAQRMYWAEADVTRPGDCSRICERATSIRQIDVGRQLSPRTETIGDLDIVVESADGGRSDGPTGRAARCGRSAGRRRHEDVGPVGERPAS